MSMLCRRNVVVCNMYAMRMVESGSVSCVMGVSFLGVDCLFDLLLVPANVCFLCI